MEIIIGIILIVIVLIIIGLILRKRVYDAVDDLESWKLDVMNRNIGTELSRIKTLNLSGETQKKFETWKSQWENIASTDLSHVEEYLFDAEEAADRYRFPSARKALQKGNEILHTIEKDLERMLEELDVLLESEQSSRQGVEEIEPQLKELQQTITHDRYTFGKAEGIFNERIQALEEGLEEYHVCVSEGEYSQAKQIVEKITEEVSQLQEEMHLFPELLTMCADTLPKQVREVRNGIDEMRELGYHIQELGVEKEVDQYAKEIDTCLKSLEKGIIDDVPSRLEEIEENIKNIYTVLEKEVLAKNYIESKYLTYFATLEQIKKTFETTQSEVEQLRETYFIEDEYMEQFLTLEKTIQRMNNQVDAFKTDMEESNVTHSNLRDRLEKGLEEMEQLKEEHVSFTEIIHNLRKDEIVAKETLENLREQMQYVQRQLNKSNIPGIPSFIVGRIEEASEKQEKVLYILNKQPLDMGAVQHALTEAERTVEQLAEEVEMSIDQANLTEHVIQYANRYRSTYPILAAELLESERLFRKYEYELALEKAAEAIEEIEPGALKQIERYQSELA